MKTKILYNIGDLVYLRTDPDQSPRMVTGILINEATTKYGLNRGVEESWHYPIEIAKDRNILMQITSSPN